MSEPSWMDRETHSRSTAQINQVAVDVFKKLPPVTLTSVVNYQGAQIFLSRNATSIRKIGFVSVEFGTEPVP